MRALDVVNKEQKPFRLVNVSGVSIHHFTKRGAIWRSAFIFGEHEKCMVNCRFSPRRALPAQQFPL
jgi:hypothetical protein